MGLLSGLGKAVKSVGSAIGSVMDTAKSVGGSLMGYLGDSQEGALSSLGKFGLDTVSSIFSGKQQVANQKSLIDYANDYNNPVAQMERLAKAGLNPNLVYANGAANLGSATGSASAIKPASFDPNLQLQRRLLHEETINQMYLGQKLFNETTGVKEDNKLKREQQEILKHNLEIARATNTPVGTMPSLSASGANFLNRAIQYFMSKPNAPTTAKEREEFLNSLKNY